MAMRNSKGYTLNFYGRSNKTYAIVGRLTGIVERDGMNKTTADRECKKLGDFYKVVESKA